jgi:hypothetical protein
VRPWAQFEKYLENVVEYPQNLRRAAVAGCEEPARLGISLQVRRAVE